MKKLFLSIAIVALAITSWAQASRTTVIDWVVVGTNGGAFSTNVPNSSSYRYSLGGSSQQTSIACFSELLSSSATSNSNVVFQADFSIFTDKWDTNTTVIVTNAYVPSTNWAYRLSSITVPAHARWMRVKRVDLPAGATTNSFKFTFDRVD
jgi:hypothetical protein